MQLGSVPVNTRAVERADRLREDHSILWRPMTDRPQEEFLRRVEFEAGYGGAKGGGKSDAINMGASEQTHHPKYHGIIFRRTYGELQDLIDRARAVYHQVGARWNEQKKRFTFPSGARITYAYCEDVGDEDRYLGREYTYMGFDQLEQMTELQYTKLISCARTSVAGLRVMVRSSFNPGGVGHMFVRRRFVDLGPYQPYVDPETGLSRVFIPARVYDNPILMRNDPGYVQRLLNIPDPALRRALLEGDFNVFAGQFFAEWRDELHVVEVRDEFPIPEGWGRSAGLDWGYDPHPGVVEWAAYDLHQRAWFYRELVFHQEPPLAVAKLIEEKSTDDAERTILIRADTQMWEKEPSSRRGDSIALEINRALHNAGLKVTLVPAKKDRTNGWARVHQYLDPRRPRPDGKGQGPYARFFRANLQTGLGCPYAIETLPAQIHDDHAGREWDLKKSSTDHAADAVRYELMDRPPLSVLPLAEHPGQPHDRAIHARTKQLYLAAMARVERAPEDDAEGPMPTTLTGFNTTVEDDDPGLIAEVYGG
jgi:hypothetical protein